MKRSKFSFYLVMVGIVCSLVMTGCLNGNSNNSTENKDVNSVVTTSDFTQAERLRGTKITDKEITFIFDKTIFASQVTSTSAITGVYLAGSFNGWNITTTGGMKMTAVDANTYIYTAPKADIMVPGNSGHPEFKFVPTINNSPVWTQPPETLEVGYRFFQKINDYNAIVVLPTDDFNKIVNDSITAMTVKTKESDFASSEELSNFREVKTGTLGAKKLFRSYHPYIASRAGVADLKSIEEIKQQKVQELMAANNIKSIINLSDSAADITANTKTTAYYRAAYDANNVLLAVTSYNVVYFKSTGDDYAKLMKSVTDFVKTHDAPFMVHCRLGTDRTGVVTAFLEGLMGATWREIADEYVKSNRMNFREFRSELILKYSFEKLLGITLNDNTTIDTALANYLKTNPNILYTDTDIQAVKNKLK